MGPLALALIAFCTATPQPAAAQAPAPPPLSPIRSSDRSIHFFDAHGRVRIFHGAARVQKKPPWYFPDLLEGDTEARAMEALGFNVLRLGFMWSGYNPAPGVFNQSYIDVIKTTVAQLNAHGVYVLLDMHQDILSSAFCLYDGAPRWVRLIPLKNGGDHSCCDRFGPLRNRPTAFWCRLLDSWRRDGENSEKTEKKASKMGEIQPSKKSADRRPIVDG